MMKHFVLVYDATADQSYITEAPAGTPTELLMTEAEAKATGLEIRG
jgi:hypothetical protein